MNHQARKINLDNVRIASPCKANWNEMSGDERSRHCRECKLNVYNVAGLTKKEAEALLEKAAGGQRVCMRFARRADGTIITADCPVGVKIARRLKMRAAALRLTVSTAVLWLMGVSAPAKTESITMGKIAAPTSTIQSPPAPVNNNLNHQPEVNILGQIIAPPEIGEAQPEEFMGDVAVPDDAE